MHNNLINIDGYYVVKPPRHCYGIAVYGNKITVFKDAKILASGWFNVEGNRVSLNKLTKLDKNEKRIVKQLIEKLIWKQSK